MIPRLPLLQLGVAQVVVAHVLRHRVVVLYRRGRSRDRGIAERRQAAQKVIAIASIVLSAAHRVLTATSENLVATRPALQELQLAASAVRLVPLVTLLSRGHHQQVPGQKK